MGNKIDMRNEVETEQQEAADELARNMQIDYYQTSAKDGTGIEKAIRALLTNILANSNLE